MVSVTDFTFAISLFSKAMSVLFLAICSLSATIASAALFTASSFAVPVVLISSRAFLLALLMSLTALFLDAVISLLSCVPSTILLSREVSSTLACLTVSSSADLLFFAVVILSSRSVFALPGSVISLSRSVYALVPASTDASTPNFASFASVMDLSSKFLDFAVSRVILWISLSV